MRAIRSVPVSLLTLVILMPNARAQEQQLPVVLVQTANPITRSYPGVSLGILGIQTGMTVAQVEAIAAKNDLGKPLETKIHCVFTYNNITARSQEFIVQVEYGHGTNRHLILYFNSPATGNTVSSMRQVIKFPDDPLKQPLQSALKADLIKQYGPPSAPDVALTGGADNFVYYSSTWLFGDKSNLQCHSGFCPSIGSIGLYQQKDYDLSEIHNYFITAFAESARSRGVDFIISSIINTGTPSYQTKTSASSTVTMADFQAAEGDINGVKQQFQNAISKSSSKKK